MLTVSISVAVCRLLCWRGCQYWTSSGKW